MRHFAPSRRGLFAAGLGLAAGGATAQPGWPERSVRLINSGAPGSGIDLLARVLAEGLSARLGQVFVVENRPGAGSVLAAQGFAQARPGEALLLGATGIASTVPYTFQGRLPFDPEADLVPLAIPASEFLCFAVPASLGVTDLAGWIAQARQRPGTFNWNSVPGFAELHTQLFLREQGLEASFVAYPGSPPAIIDLAAGRIQAGVLPLTPLLGAIREGRVRALAVTSGERAPALPDVPTVAEAGFAGFRYDPFSALFGWRGMEPGLRARVAAAAGAAMREPGAVARLAAAGIVARDGDGEALARVIAEQRARVQEAIRVVGIRPAG